MLEKGRISSIQFYTTAVMVVLGTIILYVPGLAIRVGGRDAWLSPIFAGMFGLIVMGMMFYLNKLFPNQTPIEYTQIVFGKWFGGFLCAYLLWTLLRYFSIMLREATDFVITGALSRTPPEMVSFLMLIVVLYIARKGLEVIVRFTQFVVIIELLQMVVSIILLASKDVEVRHLTPLFEHGLSPLLRSSLLLSSWFGELMVVGFVFPYLRVRHGTKKAIMWSTITLILLVMLAIIYTIGVFGDVLAGRMLFGLYEVARYISVAEFLERLDPIVMGTWIMFMFCKLVLFCYVISLGLSQLFRLTDYRPMVSAICVIAFTMSEHMFVNQGDMVDFLLHVASIYSTLISFAFPLLNLLVAIVRKKRGEHHA